jgi:hypothetical protein
MATQTLYDEDGNPVEVEIPEPATPPGERTNSEWAELRKEKQARKAAEEKAAAFERRDAIRDAGIDTSSPLGKFFADKYDGEPTADAVKAAAIAAGFVETGDPAPGQAVPDPAVAASLEAADRIAAASPGAGVIEPQGSIATLDEAYLAGGTEAMIDKARELGIVIQESQ